MWKGQESSAMCSVCRLKRQKMPTAGYAQKRSEGEQKYPEEGDTPRCKQKILRVRSQDSFYLSHV